MKKIIALLMVLCICFCLVGCGRSYSSSSKSKSSSQTSSKSSASKHECYVCGKKASKKYGSHYYCSTHYSYVKTVTENQ